MGKSEVKGQVWPSPLPSPVNKILFQHQRRMREEWRREESEGGESEGGEMEGEERKGEWRKGKGRRKEETTQASSSSRATRWKAATTFLDEVVAPVMPLVVGGQVIYTCILGSGEAALLPDLLWASSLLTLAYTHTQEFRALWCKALVFLGIKGQLESALVFIGISILAGFALVAWQLRQTLHLWTAMHKQCGCSCNQ